MQKIEQEQFFLEWFERNGIDIDDFLQEDLEKIVSHDNETTNNITSKKIVFLDRIKNMLRQVRTKKLPMPEQTDIKEETKTLRQKRIEFIEGIAQNPDTSQALENVSTERTTAIKDKEK